MTKPIQPLLTRPGGHSAKNVRPAGAPNTQQSGENPMVDAYSAACAVDEVQARIGGHAYRFLSVDDQGRLCVDFVGLAELIAEIVDEYTQGLRAALDEMRWESGIRENEVVQLGYELERAEARLAELDSARLGVRDA